MNGARIHTGCECLLGGVWFERVLLKKRICFESGCVS